LPVLAGIVLVSAGLAACGGSDGSAPLETPDESLSSAVAAPEFPSGHTWFNVREPLTIAGLRGKMVVLDFWTLGCINCQHIVPDLKRLEEEFGDELVVIGVHSGKYDREHDDDSIREAILRLGLEHPVVNDPDFAIWNTYQANAWPTVTVIDPAGNIVGAHPGEGVYDVVQPVLAQLEDEFADQIDTTPIPLDLLAEPISTAFLSFPGAVLVDEAGGRLFIADSGNNRILVAGLDGELQSAIGTGAQGLKDGFADEAEFNQPHGLELSEDGGTLYVADTRNHALRTVDLETGEVETIAGTGTRAFAYPPEGSVAEEEDLASPWGLQLIDATMYIAMAGTHQIWSLDLAAGTISVFAGSGRENIDDGPRLNATLAQPSGLTTDGDFLYWVDPESSSVRKVDLGGDGIVETLVGKGLFEFGDVDGSPDIALLEHAQGVVYAEGMLYVADTYNHKIRTVDPVSGEANTFAGTGESGDVDGEAASAQFAEPGGIAYGGGKLYLADTNNHTIRTIDLAAGEVATLELTNLGVAVSGAQGRTIKVSLPSQEVSASTDTIQIKLRAPEGFHLNDLIASNLVFSTSDGTVFSAEEDEVTFQVSDPQIELEVPASASEGQAILSAAGEIYYCREGQEAVCLIDDVDLALPLTVTGGASSDAAVIEYELPQ
jgi:DNA-binding beta-propeller fold protein YncE